MVHFILFFIFFTFLRGRTRDVTMNSDSSYVFLYRTGSVNRNSVYEANRLFFWILYFTFSRNLGVTHGTSLGAWEITWMWSRPSMWLVTSPPVCTDSKTRAGLTLTVLFVLPLFCDDNTSEDHELYWAGELSHVKAARGEGVEVLSYFRSRRRHRLPVKSKKIKSNQKSESR